MKFIDLLHRLGIFRAGAVSGTYKSYKEMPDELMYNDVYDKKKDLTNVRVKGKGQKSVTSGSKLLFWIFLIISGLFLMFFLLSSSFSWQYLLIIILWIIVFIFWWFYRLGKMSMVISLSAFFLVIFFSLIVVTISGDDPTKVNTVADVAGDKDCAELISIYDGKVYNISSKNDDWRGAVSVKINPNNCDYRLVWHSVFGSDLIVPNSADSTSPITAYDYRVDIVFRNEGPNPLDGSIDPIFANVGLLPLDLFNERVPFDFYATPGLIAGTDKSSVTQNFHHTMLQTGTFREATIQELLAVNEIRVYAGESNNAPLQTYSVQIK